MHKHSFVLLAVLAALPSVSAQGVVLPAGLQGGDQYRLLIVTEGRRNAVSTDIADYNAFVTAEAAGNPALDALNTTWTAVCSTTTVDARDNTNTDPTPSGSTGVPIYAARGVRLADDYDELWAGALQATPGGPGYPTRGSFGVWSGTDFVGGRAAPGAELGTDSPDLGTPSVSSARWIRDFSFGAGSGVFMQPMYALSGVLTVPDCYEFKMSPNLPINDGSNVTSDIVIPSNITAAADFELGIKINHTYLGDLQISLEKVGGITPFVIYRSACRGDNMDAVFVASGGAQPQCGGDGRGVAACGAAPSVVSVSGRVLAQSLVALASQPAAGTWRLTVQDTAAGDTGWLCEWSLRLPRAVQPGSFVVTAPGCVNSLGQTVEMTSGGQELGRPFTLTVRQLLPDAPGFLALGFDLPAFPISPSCGLHVNPLLVLPFMAQSDGNAQVTPFVLPFDRSLIGVQLAVQAFGVDPAANALGLVGSPAGRVTIGC